MLEVCCLDSFGVREVSSIARHRGRRRVCLTNFCVDQCPYVFAAFLLQVAQQDSERAKYVVDKARQEKVGAATVPCLRVHGNKS